MLIQKVYFEYIKVEPWKDKLIINGKEIKHIKDLDK